MADRPLRPATDRRLGEPLPHQLANQTQAHPSAVNLSCTVFQPYSVCGISQSFDWVSPTEGQITYALLTRPPLGIATSFDLHVLSTPPAFILSQDQTLRKEFTEPRRAQILDLLSTEVELACLKIDKFRTYSGLFVRYLVVKVRLTSVLRRGSYLNLAGFDCQETLSFTGFRPRGRPLFQKM